ncbi:MAG: chemotaxis protein CheW [Bacillus sp. (in: firmicutes)]
MEMNQYLEVFIEESKEHLQSCNERLLELEKKPENQDIVKEIFRSAHTLKGMAATMGYEDLASLTHSMENVLDLIRNRKLHVTPRLLDVVFDSVDYLEEMIVDISVGGSGKKDVTEIAERLRRAETGKLDIDGPEARKETSAALAKTGHLKHGSYDEYEKAILEQSNEQGFSLYEVTVVLNDHCLLKAARVFMVFGLIEKVGEIIKASPSVEELEEERFGSQFIITIVTRESSANIEQMIKKVSEIYRVDVQEIDLGSTNKGTGSAEEVSGGAKSTDIALDIPVGAGTKTPIHTKNHQMTANKTIRVNIDRLDVLMNLFEELVIDRGRLEQISKELDNQQLNETVEKMSRISSDLQDIILNMRMVPIETVFNRFPRMVRQLARELDKNIHLEIIGADTELDRTVIDEIGDPLVHLLRNALDHGMESPELRLMNGKPEEGKIILNAYHSGNHVFIDIEDDGAGISRRQVLRKAVSKGIISEAAGETMTDEQVFDLIFASGFSTADKISDVSGRGVGLDVVKSTIESLAGSVTIHSKQGEGSIFSIQLPLTLSIISVMLVELQNEKFAIPLSSIIETSIIKQKEVMYAHNQKVIDFRGKVVPLLDLAEVFEVPGLKHDEDILSLIIVKKGDKMAGLIVDSFIGQQEVVLKSLGTYLTDVYAISGATILGDGQVALIVDCNALIK